MADKRKRVSELEKLAELHRQGDLTDEEFRAAKAELLPQVNGERAEAITIEEKAIREYEAVENHKSRLRGDHWEGLFIGCGSLVFLGLVLAFALGWCGPVRP